MLIYNIITMLMHFTATRYTILTFKVKFNKMVGFLMTVVTNLNSLMPRKQSLYLFNAKIHLFYHMTANYKKINQRCVLVKIDLLFVNICLCIINKTFQIDRVKSNSFILFAMAPDANESSI